MTAPAPKQSDSPRLGRGGRGLAGRRAGLPAALALLAVGGCIDLTKPWDKVNATDAAADRPGGPSDGSAGAATGGSSGTSTGGRPTDSAAATGGQGGSTGAPDVALAEVAPADVVGGANGGADGAGTGGIDGAVAMDGGSGKGGAAGVDGASLDAAGGAGGTTVADATFDRFDGPADRAIDAGPDGGRDAALDAFDAPADQVSPAGLLAYYPCEGPGGASGTSLVDLSGHDHHGTIATGPAPAGADADATGGNPVFSYGAGKVGNGLTLDAMSYTHVALPAGLLAGQQEMTIAAWIKVTGTAAFQRVFDFGTDTTNFMYLATAGSTGLPRFRIVSAAAADGGLSEFIEGTQAIPVGTWTHLALVLGPTGASIYVNGSLQSMSAGVTLRPADLGSTTSNFIGRSEFPKDPYFDGAIDEYRVYGRALSGAEILGLAGG